MVKSILKMKRIEKNPQDPQKVRKTIALDQDPSHVTAIAEVIQKREVTEVIGIDLGIGIDQVQR